MVEILAFAFQLKGATGGYGSVSVCFSPSVAKKKTRKTYCPLSVLTLTLLLARIATTKLNNEGSSLDWSLLSYNSPKIRLLGRLLSRRGPEGH